MTHDQRLEYIMHAQGVDGSVGLGAHTAAQMKTPAELLIEAEEHATNEAHIIAAEAEQQDRAEIIRGFLRYVIRGPKNKPLTVGAFPHVVRRLLIITQKFAPHLLNGLSDEKLQEVLTGQKKASNRATWGAAKKLVVDDLEKRGVKVRHEKSLEARQRMTAAQKGNTNRIKKLKK